MYRDTINDEIRAIRRSLAAKFDNDLVRIANDLKERQAKSGKRYVTFRQIKTLPVDRGISPAVSSS
jgi:hypothetical protein